MKNLSLRIGRLITNTNSRTSICAAIRLFFNLEDSNVKVLVSGIAHSDTSDVFSLLEKAFLKKHKRGKIIYEPYLSNSKKSYPIAKPFNENKLNESYIGCHIDSPIFLNKHHPRYGTLLDKNFGLQNKHKNIARLVHDVKSLGRLDAILNRYPETKVILVTRNIADTINSNLNLFSFYGDQFHQSDKNRFLQEINKKFDANLTLQQLDTETKWASIWWRYLTISAFNSARRFPDSVFILPYELYIQNKKAWAKKLAAFLNINYIHINTSYFEHYDSPKASFDHLSRLDVEFMAEDLLMYAKLVNEFTSEGAIAPHQFKHSLIEKYTHKNLKSSIEGLSEIKSTIVRTDTNNEASNQDQSKSTPSHPSLKEVSKDHIKLLPNKFALPTNNKSISVIISSYNNENTIKDAVLSVLRQTHPIDEVIVTDDCSTDNTLAILESLAEQHNSLTIIKRPYNVGVSANRHLAIINTKSDLISTLDGDDIYHPQKIEYEYKALASMGFRGAAYSDILLIKKGIIIRQDTAGYDKLSGKQALPSICSRNIPVPRDMLYKKTLYLNSDGFDLDINMYEDWALKMRMSAKLGSQHCWLHSGIIGTVYDRRSPGLSAKKVIFHTYCQVLVLAINRHLWEKDLLSFKKAMITIFKSGYFKPNSESQQNFEAAINRLNSSNGLIKLLDAFMKNSILIDDEKKIKQKLEQFLYTLSN